MKKLKSVIAVIVCAALVSAAGVYLYGQRQQERSKEAVVQTEKKEMPIKQATYILEDVIHVEPGEIIEPKHIDEENPKRYFTAHKISDVVFKTINGKSYTENDNIGLEELRYLKVLHYNYDHQIQVGELIVNKVIAEDCLQIFQELFAEEYEIYSMYLMDKFWVGNGVDSDTKSIENNNTSAFNYRVVPGSTHLSNHAKGRAIDLNPLQNPYVTYKSDGTFGKYYKDMEKYLNRNSGKEHMITHKDTAYKIFKKYGFTWGGDWVNSKDYQHFEKK